MSTLNKIELRTVKALAKYGYAEDACEQVLRGCGFDLAKAAQLIVQQYGAPDQKLMPSATKQAVSSGSASSVPASSASAQPVSVSTPTSSAEKPSSSELSTVKRMDAEVVADSDREDAISTRTADGPGVQSSAQNGSAAASAYENALARSDEEIAKPDAVSAGIGSARGRRAVRKVPKYDDEVQEVDAMSTDDEAGANTSRSASARPSARGRAKSSAATATGPSVAEAENLQAIVAASHKARDAARAAGSSSAAAVEAEEGGAGSSSQAAVDLNRLKQAATAVIAASSIVKAVSSSAADADDDIEEVEEQAGASSSAGAGASSGPATSSFASALPVLRKLSTLLGACVGPVSQLGLPARPVPEAAACVMSLPMETARPLMDALHAFVRHAVEVKGLLPLKAVEKKGTAGEAGVQRRTTSVLCGLEAALCGLMVMSVPSVDRRLVGEDMVTDILKMTSAHVSAHVLPCFDPLDPYWSKAAALALSGADADGGADEASGNASGARASSRARKSTGKGKKGAADEDSDNELDSDIEEVDMDEDGPSGAGASSSKPRKSTAGASAALGGPTKVTKGMLAAAQDRLRPVMLGLAFVLERLGGLAQAVPLGEALLTRLTQVALTAATQTNVSGGPGSTAGSRAAAARDSGSGSEAAKSALAVSAIGVVQALFLQANAQARDSIVAALGSAFAQQSVSKKFRRGFTITPMVPRLAGSRSNSSGAVDADAESAVHACTAIMLHLVHSVAGLPTQDECNAADGVKPTAKADSDAGAASGKAGKDAKSKAKGKAEKGKAAAEPAPKGKAPAAKAKGKAGKGSKATEAEDEDDDVEVLDTENEDAGTSGKGKAKKAASKAKPPTKGKATAADSKAKATAGKGAKGTAAAKAKPEDDDDDDDDDDVIEVPERRSAPAPAPAAPTGPIGPAAAFAVCDSLTKRYIGLLLGASDRKLSSTASAAADDEDPRAIIKRLAEDLLVLVELPEWPAAPMFMDLLVRGLRQRLGLVFPKASAPGAAIPPEVPGAEKLATHAAGVLGMVLPKLLQCRAFAASNALVLPEEDPAKTGAGASSRELKPLSEDTLACHCGYGVLKGRLHLDCDNCGGWFHGLCMGFLDSFVPAQWYCDKCVLRKQVQQQQEAAVAFAMRRVEASKASGGESSAASQSAGAGGDKDVAANALSIDADVDMADIGASSKEATGSADLSNLHTVLQQLTLNLIGQHSYEDPFQRMSRRFLISKWASSALQGRKTVQREYYMGLLELPSKTALKKAERLSSYNAGRVAIQMLADEPVLSSLDSTLNFLVSSFNVDNAKIKSSAMKALTDVIAVEPAILRSSPGVMKAVGAMLRDGSKLVRAAALDLIGEHITAQPASLLPRYAPLLLEKLQDDGVATRKKAVGIFKELLLKRQLDSIDGAADGAGASSSAGTDDLSKPVLLPRGGGYTVDVLKALLARAGDRHEEDSVKDMITATFDALWFGPPGASASGGRVSEADLQGEDYRVTYSTTKKEEIVKAKANVSAVVNNRKGASGPRADGSALDPSLAADFRARAAQIVALVDSNVSTGKDMKWLSDMLARLTGEGEAGAGGADGEGAGASGTAASNKKAAAAAARAASQWNPRAILGAFIEQMLSALSALGQRKLALLSGVSCSGAGAGSSSALESARSGTSAISGTPSGAGTDVDKEESGMRGLYQRELVAVVAALHTCAQALPGALSPHLRALAPLLKADPLLSSSHNATLQQHAAGCVELAVVLARDVTPTVLGGIETDLLALVRDATSPAVMQAAAAALGVLITAVTGDDTRTRQLLASMLDKLEAVKGQFIAVAKDKASKAGQLASFTPDRAAVVWLREWLATVNNYTTAGAAAGPAGPANVLAAAASAKNQLQTCLRALFGAGLLVKYCDLDRAGASGRTAMPEAEEAEQHEDGDAMISDDDDVQDVDEDSGEEDSLDGSSCGGDVAEDSDDDIDLSLGNLNAKAKGPQPSPKATASSDNDEEDGDDGDEVAGWGKAGASSSAGSKPLKTFSAKRGKATPTGAAGSASAFSGAAGAEPSNSPDAEGWSSARKAPKATATAAAGGGKGSSKAKAKARDIGTEGKDKGKIVSAKASVKASAKSKGSTKASGAKAVKATPSGKRSVTAAASSSSPSAAVAVPVADAKTEAAVPRGGTVKRVYEVLQAYGSASLKLAAASRRMILTSSQALRLSGGNFSSTELVDKRKQLQSAQLVLKDIVSVGWNAVRALGLSFCRLPGLALTEDGRLVLQESLASPLPTLKEAGLRVLADLLSSQDERHDVARALEARAMQDARTVAAMLASGGHPTPALLASAAGAALQSALLRAAPKSSLLAASAAVSSGVGASGAPSSAISGRVAVTKADGTVIEGRAHVLGAGAADTSASMLTGIVQEHWDTVRKLLSYAPDDVDKELGIAEPQSGEVVRGAATTLLGLVIKQGARAPDDTIPLLIALSTDEAAIADSAHGYLLHQSEQYPTQVERAAVSGIIASCGHQMDVFGSAGAREPAPLDMDGEPIDNAPPGAPLLGRLWSSCICRNPSMNAGAPLSRARLTVLRTLINRVVPDTIAGLHGTGPGGLALPSSRGGAAGAGAGSSGLLATLGMGANSAGLKRAEAISARIAASHAAGGAGEGGDTPAVSTPAVSTPLLSSAHSVPDVLLNRYVCSTLAALPYEREEDLLTIAVYVNRAAAVHADALLASLRRFLPKKDASEAAGAGSGSADASEGGMGLSLPPPGHPAYTALAAHAAYTYALACLLRTKRYLKDLYRLPDGKISSYDPAAPLASRVPDKALDSVEVKSDLDLPNLPQGFVTALAGAVAAAKDRETGAASGASAGGFGAAPGSAGRPSAASSPAGPRAVLTSSMLQYLSGLLEEALSETAGDFNENLAGVSFKKRVAKPPKAKKGAEGGDGEEAGAAGAGSTKKDAAKKASAAKKRRRAKKDDDGDDGDEDGGEDEAEYVARPSKRRAAAQA